MAQILLPDSDVEVAGWSNPSWSVTDDNYPGGSDLTTSSTNPSGIDFEVGLTNGTDPGTDKGHRVRYRISGNANGTRLVDYLVQLKQGSTVIASQTTNHGGTTHTWYSFLLTEAEAANITDYTDLRIRVVATKTAGGNVAARVEALQFEVPDVGSVTAAMPGGVPAANLRCWLPMRLMGHANNAAPNSLQDWSGNGNSLWGANPATFKTGIYNGFPVLEFDGVNDQYRMFWASAAERITYFLIFRHLTLPATGGQAIISGESGGSAKVMLSVDENQGGLSGNHYVIEQTGATNHEYFGAGIPSSTVFTHHRQRYDSGATGDRGWSDGVEMTDGTLPGDAGSNASSGCKLGSREDDTRFWNGQLAELIVAQGLTDQQELDIEAYLRSAYAPAPIVPRGRPLSALIVR